MIDLINYLEQEKLINERPTPCVHLVGIEMGCEHIIERFKRLQSKPNVLVVDAKVNPLSFINSKSIPVIPDFSLLKELEIFELKEFPKTRKQKRKNKRK